MLKRPGLWAGKADSVLKQVRASKILGQGLTEALERSEDGVGVSFVEVRLTAKGYMQAEGAEPREGVLPGSRRESLEALRELAASLFEWYGSDIINLTTNRAMLNNSELAAYMRDFEDMADARMIDRIEAIIECAATKLDSTSSALRYLGCHAVWELACRKANHEYLQMHVVEAVIEQLGSPELKVRATAAAALWTLAEVAETLARMPSTPLVRALLSAAELAADEVPSDLVAARASHESDAALLLKRPVAELIMYPIGALVTVLTTEDAARGFYRAGGVKRMLPMLMSSSASVRRAVAALFAQTCAVSASVCAALLHVGAEQLTRMACGWDGNEAYSSRCQAADLLNFIFSRVRLSLARDRDADVIDQLPGLAMRLRAAMVSLLPLGGISASGTEREALLLRGLLGSLWGMAAALQAVGRRLPPTPGTVLLLSKLIPPPPVANKDKGTRATAGPRGEQRAGHASQLRIAALGMTCLLDLSPSHLRLISSEVSEAEGHAERKQARLEGVLTGTERERAAVRVQMRLRGRLARKRCLRIVEERIAAGGAPFDLAAAAEAKAGAEPARKRGRAKTDVAQVAGMCSTAMGVPTARSGLERVDDEETVLAFFVSAAVSLLDHLERSLRAVRALTAVGRLAECTAAAFAHLTIYSTEGVARANGLPRLLALCDVVHEQSGGAPLSGHAAVMHSHLCAATLTIVAAPTAGGKFPSRAVLISRTQLESVCRALTLSRGGKISGSALVWLQACAGAAGTLGEVGAVEQLGAVLLRVMSEAVSEGAGDEARDEAHPEPAARVQPLSAAAGRFAAPLSKPALASAEWASIALWRLTAERANAARALASVGTALVAMVAQTHHDGLRSCAIGCLIPMLLDSELRDPALAMGVPELLAEIAALRTPQGAPIRPMSQRLTALCLLDKLAIVDDTSAELAATADRADCEDGSRPPPPPPPPFASHSEAEAAASPYLDALSHQQEPLTVRSMACRSLARCVLRGGERAIVEGGGCKLLAKQVRFGAGSVLNRPELPAPRQLCDEEETPAEAAARKRAKAVAHVEKEALLLLRDALCATLNLSGAECAQPGLCRHGLWSLVALWATPRPRLTQLTTSAAAAEIHSMVGGILSNLATHRDNRNPMYKAELQLKMVACGGSYRLADQLPPLSLVAEHEPDAMLASEIRLEGAQELEEPPDGEETVVDAGDASVKDRFLEWLETTVAAQPPKGSLRELTSVGHQEADRAVTKAEAAAGAAFALMGKACDGCLTRMEVIRAFRCDDRVREALLPLLPMPKGMRWVSTPATASDVAQQCDVFEALFDTIDGGVSDDISAADFAAFFSSRAQARAYRDNMGRSVTSSAAEPKSPLPSHGLPATSHGSPRALGVGGQRSLRATRGPGVSLPPIGAFDAVSSPASSPTKRSRGIPRFSSPRLGSPRSARANGGNSLKHHESFNELLRRSYATTWETPVEIGKPPSPRRLPEPPAGAARARPGVVPTPSPRHVRVQPQARSGDSGLAARTGADAGQRIPTSAADARTIPLVPGETDAGGKVSPRVVDPASPRGVPLHERWAPGIAALHSESRRAQAGPPLTWQEAYLLKEEPLFFSVDLPVEEHYTTRFRFTGEGLSEAALASRLNQGARVPASMFSWQAAVGSRVGAQIACAFELSDGRSVRLYHRPVRRNWRQAERDILPLPPDRLGALHLDTLPTPPPAPIPTRRDLPKVVQSIFMGSPSPSFHTLPVASPEVWYGTIPREGVQFGARREMEPVAAAAASASSEPEEKPPWLPVDELDMSIFGSRKRDSDGRSFYTPPTLTERSFEIDWSRLNSERFRSFLEKTDGANIEGVDNTMQEVKEVLLKHRAAIYSAYSYYCVTATIRVYDGFVLGCDSGLQVFAADTKILDEKSEHCKREHIKLLFMYANQEDRRTRDPKQQLASQVNADRALLRYEFIQVIVRLAISKFIHEKRTDDISVAVAALFDEFILPNLCPAALHDENVFREKRMYMRSVTTLFEKHKRSLQNIFDHFCVKAAVRDPLIIGNRTARLRVRPQRCMASARAGLPTVAIAACARVPSPNPSGRPCFHRRPRIGSARRRTRGHLRGTSGRR